MYKMLTIGLSAGGIPLIKQILSALPANYPLPIAIVAHLPARPESYLAELLNQASLLPVCYAQDKQTICSGSVYIAPPDYHLLVEKDHFSLSVDPPILSVRPSINVLFESAAEVFEEQLIAVLLSGANTDGAEGMAYVKQLGGLGIVLNPQMCQFNTMPNAAISRCAVDYVSSIDEIISLLRSVHE